MIKIIFKLLIIILLMLSCKSEPVVFEETCCAQKADSLTQLMQVVDYEHGENEPIPNLQEPLSDKEFSIVVDTQFKEKNFISHFEAIIRCDIYDFHAAQFVNDYTNLNYYELGELSKRQQTHWVKNRLRKYQKLANSIHSTNNIRQQQVWLINHSADTIYFPLNHQSSFRCRLEAVAKDGSWKPIQCSNALNCTMNDSHITILPKMANRFTTNLPNKGSFKTKFRYRILTGRRYYYSNEFDGAINCCAFVIDSTAKQYPDLSDYKWDKNGYVIRPIIEDKKSLKTRLKETMERMERFLED